MEITKCLIKKCENDATTRGLCQRCYAIALKMMLSGETTEEVLLNNGMINPKRVTHQSFFRDQFNEICKL